MKKLTILLAAAAAVNLSAVLPAQLTQHSWLWAGLGTFTFGLPPTYGWLVCTGGMTGQNSSMENIGALYTENGAEFWYFDGHLFFGTHALHRVTLNGTVIASDTTLASMQGITALTKRGSRLWMTATTGGVFSADAVAPGTPVLEVQLNVATTGQPLSLCTDGRELFIGCAMQAGQAARVWAFDPATSTLRGLALPPQYGADGSIVGVSLAANGTLRCVDADGYMHGVDRRTGARTTLNFGSPLPTLSQLGQSVSAAAHNPWTGVTAVSGAYLGFSPTNPRPYPFLYGRSDATGAWTSIAGGSGGYGSGSDAAPVMTPPFRLFGRECPNAAGAGARMAWSGLPQLGGTCQLRMYGAEPNAVAFSWIGLSAAQWPGVGTLPRSLASFGAPGCDVLASPDAVLLVFANAAGEAQRSLQLPNIPALSGLALFAQWGATTGANALGLATSDAVRIAVR